ncbi:hypothetical protein BC332_13484 [Capsicum chinense]|nr:hypothetical protein BC332_13484 [Capsicum chinense]
MDVSCDLEVEVNGEEIFKDANKRGALSFATREDKTDLCKYLVKDLKIDVNEKYEEGVPSVGFDPDLIRTRYALLLWDYGSRKEEAKAQSDDEAPMRPPQKIGITGDTEVHDL